jgi:hypothetical protein
MGFRAKNDREKNAAPFPHCTTTEEILACQEKARKAGLIVIGWDQRPLVLRAPNPGENGVVVAESNDDQPRKLVLVLTAETAATGRKNSRLWVVNKDYPLLGSQAAVMEYDKERKKQQSSVAKEEEQSSRRMAATTTHTLRAQESTSTGKGSINIWRLIAHHELGEEVAQWSRREGVIAVGHGGMGDLNKRHFQNASDLAQIIAANHPHSSTSNCVNGGHSLWRLYSEMKIGDLVILSASSAGRVLTMRVTGGYFFVGDEFPPYYEHRRKAEAVPIDPNHLWRVSGGAAGGENVRRTLIRCAHALTQAEYHALIA